MVGISGAAATRSLVVTASPRKLPDRTCDTIEGMLAWTGLFRVLVAVLGARNDVGVR